jgi:non-haem Fe2+, alpha-ketoglutarate-dependent halogenase
MKSLSNLQIADYHRDGICFPVDALTQEEVHAARYEFERFESYFGGSPSPERMRHLQLFLPWARRLALHTRVLDAVEDLIGPDILVHSATMFCKHPGDGAYVSWHQDGHYWGLDEPRLVSAWVALAPSTPENGCLRVVRGSHQTGNLPHGETALSERNLLTSGLEVAVQVDESEASDVVLNSGQMSLHNVNIVHGSKPNRSSSVRIGFAIRYVSPEVKQRTTHPPVLVARGRNRNINFAIFEGRPYDSIPDAVAACEAFCAEVQRIRGR